MKLDPTHLRYLTREDWRVLTAVSLTLPSNLRSGSGAHKSISTLAKANLIARVQHAKYDGYRLTYGGLDYLALHTHLQKKSLHSTGPMIGTGKESDIHIVLSPPITPSSSSSQQSRPPTRELILKIHRLGRISFRSIKTNRDYLRHRSSATWLYMSRLSALKEFTFMTALHEIGFPVPRPVAWNRHTVVMSLIEGTPLYQIRKLEAKQAKELYAELVSMIVRLAGVGLIHGDFNEFNIMIEEREEEEGSETPTTLHPTLIDFPQMLSISHPNAPTYFDRDVNCIKRYFSRRYHFTSDEPGPFFADVEKQMRKSKGGRRLDVEVEASGFSKKMAKELERYMEEVGVEAEGENEGDEQTGDESEEVDEDFEETRSQDGNIVSPARAYPVPSHDYEKQEISVGGHALNSLHGSIDKDVGVPIGQLGSMSIVSHGS
ncbi:MAG: hypothetical protein Q9170_003824 [Blastenia crenularia]